MVILEGCVAPRTSEAAYCAISASVASGREGASAAVDAVALPGDVGPAPSTAHSESASERLSVECPLGRFKCLSSAAAGAPRAPESLVAPSSCRSCELAAAAFTSLGVSSQFVSLPTKFTLSALPSSKDSGSRGRPIASNRARSTDICTSPDCSTRDNG